MRSLLARLAIDVGRPVSATSLADAVWDGDLPGDEAHALQSLVSRLRRALGDPRMIVQGGGGYRLALDPEDVDGPRFERLAREGERLRARDASRAAELLREALSLWRGPALAGVEGREGLAAAAGRLDDLRLVAHVDRIDADFGLGRAGQLVAELEALHAGHPLHERRTPMCSTCCAHSWTSRCFKSPIQGRLVIGCSRRSASTASSARPKRTSSPMCARERSQPEAAAEILGAAARLRGAEDPTHAEIARITRLLRDQLGEGRFAELFAQGRELDRDGAIARIDPAGLED